MSWRDNAVKIENVENSQPSSWRERARRIDLERPENTATPPANNNALDIASNAIGQTPLGMAARGTQTAFDVMGKVFQPFIPAEPIRKVAKPLFGASRALGVGAMKNLTELPTPANRANLVTRSMAAYEPDFKPQGMAEEIGTAIGTNAPTVAATVMSPTVGGPAAFMGQQAYETGKISPVPAALALAGPATRGVVKPLFKKALSYAGDIPEESVAYKLENPGAVKSARDISEIASKDVPGIAKKFDQTIFDLNKKAKENLSTSVYLNDGAFTKDEIIGSIQKARKELGGVYTSESETASKTLAKLSSKLKKIRNTVSQNQVHDLIIDLDQEIPWKKVWRAPETLTREDEAMISVRTKLDGILKEKNSKYGEMMKPVSNAIETRNEYLKALKLDKIKGQGYKPSDATPGRLFGATNENRLATRRILGQTKEILGEDLEPRVRASQVKADFEPETGRSFRGGEIGIRQSIGRPLVSGVTSLFGKVKTPSMLKGVTTGKVFKLLPAMKAQEYLRKAGGDKKRAREMALNDGWRLK